MQSSIVSFARRTTGFRLGFALVGSALAVAACSSDAVGPAASIAVGSGSNQTGTVGMAGTPLVAHVTDASGNAVSGVSVTFNSNGTAILATPTVTTDGSGNAKTAVTLGTTAGTINVTATAVGVATPATFQIIAHAGAASTVSAFAGNAQSGTHGTLLTDPLVVIVRDQYANVVSNAMVNWAASAGTLTTPTSTADATGKASNGFTLGLSPGSDTVTVTLPGSVASALFVLTSN